MWYLDVANLLHAFLASLLLFQQFALTAHVTAVALGQHVLTHLLDGFAGDDLRADSSLNGDIELLEKQKRGKKRMKQIGNVEVPQKAFLAVLKLD